MKYFIINGGGLGDCFIRYFGIVPNSNQSWGKLIPLKTSKVAYVKGVLPVHNTAIVDFLRFHPGIDELQVIPFGPHWNRWADLVKGEGWYDMEDLDIPAQPPQLFLGPYDEEWWQKVTGGRPYVVVHANAGTPERDLQAYLDFSKFDQQVFVIGGSSLRTVDRTSSYVIEYLPREMGSNVTDLIGVCNSRLATLLISRATHFHGTFSAYAWAAIGCGTPRTIYIPKDFREDDYTKLMSLIGVELRTFEQFPYFEKRDHAALAKSTRQNVTPQSLLL